MNNAAILVDEINAMNQFHQLGIEGINPWVSFFETTEKIIKAKHKAEEVNYHIYGAVIPKDIDLIRHQNRRRFFKALTRDGINVHKAFCLPNSRTNELIEKGVDMMLGLDMAQKAQEGIKHLYVFSADTDLVPAVQRAQSSGSKVTAIISKSQPAKIMRRYVNDVLHLEDLISNIPVQNIIKRKGEIAL